MNRVHKTEVSDHGKPFVLSPITLELMDHLRSLRVGETVSWNELKIRHRIDFQQFRHYQVTAVKRLEEEEIYIRCVSGVGLKSVTKDEAVDWCRGHREHLMRGHRRTARVLASINSDDLDSDGKQKLVIERLMTGAIIAVNKAKPDQIRRLTEGVTTPPVKSLLEVIAKHEQ